MIVCISLSAYIFNHYYLSHQYHQLTSQQSHFLYLMISFFCNKDAIVAVNCNSTGRLKFNPFDPKWSNFFPSFSSMLTLYLNTERPLEARLYMYTCTSHPLIMLMHEGCHTMKCCFMTCQNCNSTCDGGQILEINGNFMNKYQ